MLREKGFTLIEAMIAIAILMTTSLGFIQLVEYMNNQILGSQRKVESLELKSAVAMVLSNQAVCSCMMGMYAEPVDSTDLSKEPGVSEIRSVCNAASPLIVKADSHVPGTQSNLEIADLSLSSIQSLGTANQYRGKLRIQFKPNNRFVSLRPIELEGRFSTVPTDPADKKKIEYCNFTGTGIAPTLTSPGAQTCPAGQFVTGLDNDGAVSCATAQASNGNDGRDGKDDDSDILDPASVTPWNPYGNLNPNSLKKPGKGCTGTGCVTYDFGPCTGTGCKTNGSSCSGTGCCAGPQCF